MNLCLIGTDAVVYKRRSQVPRVLRDAITVQYGNVPTNAESDMVAVTFPSDSRLTTPLKAGETPLERLEEVAADRFSDIRVSIIQCKTNWNDNAQIPLLGDMIYRGEFDEAKTNIVVVLRGLCHYGH